MKSNCKTKSAMTALVVAAMLCTAAMPVKAAESQWVNSNGTWSYVKEDGSKATGWIKEDGCWYAFDANGAMRTGWIASNEHWYFMGESGVMQSDAWVEDNGAKYYIKGTGVMAKDYVKDGYELTSEGKAIPLGESGSVVVTDPAELEGKVIEGNLYVDVTTAKELELKGVTVKGKLVVLGDNKTAGKVTLTDSTVETINTQSRNAEVVLSGKTEVKNVVIEETAKVTPDKNYKGEVENIEVQSTTKGEVVIEVPAENVSTRTYATVDVQAPVGNLEVKTDTQVKVNADVKNVTVTETAKDTTVEVAKGSTVGTITADAPVKIDGKGTVEKVEANVDGVEAGKDTTIKDVETGKDVTEAPDVTKPDKGGSSGGSGGGDYTPTNVTKTVSTKEDLRTAVADKNVAKIVINDNIELDEGETLTIAAGRNVEINIVEGKTLTTKALKEQNNKDLHTGIHVNGSLTLTGSGTIKNTSSYFTIYVADTGNFVLNGATIIGRNTEVMNETVKVFGKMTFKSGIIGDAIENAKDSNKYVLGIAVGQDAELLMDGGTINSSWFGISTQGEQSGQIITINKGTINNIGDETNIFYFPKAEHVTITGGEFTGSDGGLEMREGKLDITGGTFTTNIKKENNGTDFNSGNSGPFWATIVLGKPNIDAYNGSLIVNIDGAIINGAEGGHAVILVAKYSEGHADEVAVNISVDQVKKGLVEIFKENGTKLEKWDEINEGKYSYHHPDQTVTPDSDEKNDSKVDPSAIGDIVQKEDETTAPSEETPKEEKTTPSEQPVDDATTDESAK